METKSFSTVNERVLREINAPIPEIFEYDDPGCPPTSSYLSYKTAAEAYEAHGRLSQAIMSAEKDNNQVLILTSPTSGRLKETGHEHTVSVYHNMALYYKPLEE